MKISTLSAILLFFAYYACAQDAVTRKLIYAHQHAISFTTGTQGVGLDYRYGATARLAWRIGGNMLPVNANDVLRLSGFHAKSIMSGRFANVHMLLDVTPVKSFRFLRMVTGAAYFVQANGHINVDPTDTYRYGEIVLDQEQVGRLKLNMDWQGFAPYLGLGLVHAFPQHRFNINLDLGTYYLNRPRADIDASGLLAGNVTQSGQFQKNVADYRFYPQLQINFNFKLK